MNGGTCSPHAYTNPSWSSSVMCGGSTFYTSEMEVFVMASTAYPTSSYPTPYPTQFPTSYQSPSLSPGVTTPSTTASVCTDSCGFASDGECDDGGPGSDYDECDYGHDCTDCGTRFKGLVCTDLCSHANDGECDDGGYGSFDGVCSIGTDCTDCGLRTLPADNTQTKAKEGLQLVRYVRGPLGEIQAALLEDVPQQSENASIIVFKLNTFNIEMETVMQVIDLWVFAIQQASLRGNRKLVIDVIGNGGGLVFLPNVLLKILFGYSAEDLCELYDFRAGIPQLDYMLKYFVGKEMQMPAEITDDFLNQLANDIDMLDGLTDLVLHRLSKGTGSRSWCYTVVQCGGATDWLCVDRRTSCGAMCARHR